jgi:aspartyl aminopeptidase
MKHDPDALLAYIEKSPSPYHCVAETARILREHGFDEVDETAEPRTWQPGDGGFVRRAGTLIAWRTGHAPPAAAGYRLLGAHTDSPNLRIKPRPDAAAEGYVRWGVEVYGGVLLATWPDRDLGLAGRVFVRGDDGKPVEKLIREDGPVARIPNVAIHLNRTVNKDGLKLNEQKNLVPLIGLVAPDGDPKATLEDGDARRFAKWLEQRVDAEVLSWDIGLFDTQAPARGGLDGEFLFSARLDNQASCFAALAALCEAKAASSTQVMVLFDHEEIGSRSSHGAMGSWLRDTLSRLEREHAESAKGGLERALASSWLISLDMAHGIHPNYADLHEPLHKPAMNGGPVIKEHVEQRYATDAETSAMFKLAAEREEVPVQEFVIRTDMACGSTIGPISSAQLGVRTIDVGNAMLSMHSIREQCGAHDGELLVKVLKRVLSE